MTIPSITSSGTDAATRAPTRGPGRPVTPPRPAGRWTHRGWLVAAAALLTVVLVGTLRVWLPSLVHVAGDGAATPTLRLALVAAALLLLPLPVAAGVRRIDPRLLWRAGVLVLAAARLGLQLTDGGRAQLVLAGVGVVAGAVALVAFAAGTPSGHLVRVGLVLGLGIDTVGHAALGTVDLVWRAGPLPLLVTAALVVALVVAAEQAATVPLWWPSPLDDLDTGSAVWTRGHAWPWLAVGPALLLAGSVGAVPARLELAADVGPATAVLLLGLAAGLGVLVAALGPIIGAPTAGTVGALLVLLCTVAAVRPVGVGSALAQLGLPVAIGAVLGAPGTTPADSGPRRRGWAAAAGLLLFLGFGAASQNATDLPVAFGDEALLVAAAVVLGTVGLTASVAGHTVGRPDRVPLRGLAGAASALVVLGALGAAAQPTVAPSVAMPSEPGTARVAYYDIGAGYDARGRFDVDALVTTIAATDADVVVLGDVDRGRLLEGGHDLLRLLRDATGMQAVFVPGVDALHGVALLTDLPVASVRVSQLPGGSGSGRGLLSATVDTGDGPLGVVGVQLHDGDGDASIRLAQARAVAAEVSRLRSAGLPVALLGGLQAPLDAPELEPLAFLVAAVPAGPQASSSSGSTTDPDERLDHLLVTPEVRPSDLRVLPSTRSAHPAVAATVVLPSGDD